MLKISVFIHNIITNCHTSDVLYKQIHSHSYVKIIIIIHSVIFVKQRNFSTKEGALHIKNRIKSNYIHQKSHFVSKNKELSPTNNGMNMINRNIEQKK